MECDPTTPKILSTAKIFADDNSENPIAIT
jgi:hypothetical protein